MTIPVTFTVATSGRTLVALFGAGHWVGDASHGVSTAPTISVNGGGPITLAGPIECQQNPWVVWPLASKINPGATVTWSAPDGWAAAQSGSIAGATNGAVVNKSGVEMFPLPPITMGVGVNTRYVHNAASTNLLRNMRKRCQPMVAESDHHGLALDANFNATSIGGGDHAICLLQQGFPNGIDNLHFPQAPGIYTVTWEDHAIDGSSVVALEPDPNAFVTVTAHGPKVILSGPPPYVFRQQYDIQPVGGGVSDGLNAYIQTNAPYPTVRNIRIAGPGDDPDSTKITSDSALARLAGAKCVRFMFGSEGIKSSVATYAKARKKEDFGNDCQRSDTCQVSSVAAISGGAVQWNGGSYPVTNKSTFFAGASNACALRFTTVGPHPFYTGQYSGSWSLVNQTFHSGSDHNGVQVVGNAGSAWATAVGWAGTIYAVDSTHFDLIQASVNSSGPSDPDMSLGPQIFDTSANQSTLTVRTPNDFGTVSYYEQVQIAIELGAYLHLVLGESMTDACVASVATECHDAWVAMGSPAWFRIYCEYANEVWNNGYPVYGFARNIGTKLGLSQGQAYAYLANRATSAFKAVWDGLGQTGMVRRMLSCQFGNAGSYTEILGYAHAQGYGVEAVADAPYTGIMSGFAPGFASDAWDGLDTEQRHDAWEWIIQYGQSGPGDSPANNGVGAVVATYYPNAERIGYESGLDRNNPGPNNLAIVRDFLYHPRMYRTWQLQAALIQGYGYSFVNHFALESIDNDSPYALYMWPLQPPGMGLSNIFTGALGGKNQDWGSADGTAVQQSVAGKAFLDWNAAAAGPDLLLLVRTLAAAELVPPTPPSPFGIDPQRSQEL